MESKLFIKDICKNKGVSLNKLAARIGVTPSSLSQTINGDNPGVATLEKIANVLGVSFLDLFVMPSEELLDSRFFEFRNTCAKEIYMKVHKDWEWCETDEDCESNYAKVAIKLANKLANALSKADEDSKFADKNFKLAVFCYCDGRPEKFVGVFGTYDKALDAAYKDSENFRLDWEDEYILCDLNRDYCAENLERPEDIIYCDGEVLFRLEPTEEYKKQNPNDAEVYWYEVRTLFLDEPLVEPFFQDQVPEQDDDSLTITNQELEEFEKNESQAQ